MIPIDDHKNLFRDENSGAIVNGDTYEYLQYVRIKNEKKKQIYRIGNCDLLTFAGQSIPLINLRKYLCIDESLNINDLDYIPDHCLVITINSEDKVYGLEDKVKELEEKVKKLEDIKRRANIQNVE